MSVVFKNSPLGITANKLNKAFLQSGGGTGSGDMTKAVYDADGNGIVDTADSIPWSKVTGKPPALGDMTRAVYDVNNDGISDHAALADTAPWAGITGKPATFPPDSTAMLKSVYDTNGNGVVDTADAIPWSSVTGKPTGNLVDPGIWTNLTYSTGWTLGTIAQFRVETNGSFQKVIAQGIINYVSGAASLAFTLPVGARPSVARGCVVAGFDSTGDMQLFQANVATSGAVAIVPMVRQNFSWPSATSGSVYLDSLVFSL